MAVLTSRRGTGLALFVVVAFAPSAWCKDQEKLQDHYFDSAGTKIHYVELGEGEPVILIHGFGANLSVNWAGLMGGLSEGFRVIAIDNRGHGKSDKPHEPGAYGMEMVRDVVRLMDHLDIERAHIVGYSMGAFITGKFLATYPERVISATLGGAGWIEIDDKWRSLLADISSSLEAGKGVMPLLKFLHSTKGAQISDAQLQTINTALRLMNDTQALALVIRQMPDLAVPQSDLKTNTRPVLGVVGEFDPFRESVETLGGLLPDAKVIVMDGGDHITTIRKPELLAVIKQFLDANRLAPLEAAAAAP